MTVADLRGLADAMGITIKSRKKADIVDEIAAQYK
jgi:hypothetical protein